MIRRVLLAGFTVALLSAGCATTSYEVVMTRYREAPICCKSFSVFSYEDLHPGDSKSFDLNDQSPAFTFDTGKSYFKAFRLPPFSAPYRIIIRSYILGDDLRSAYIFLPQVTLLNDRNEVTRSTDFRFLKLEEAGFAETAKETWGIMRKLEGHIDVTAENRQERYLIVFTTEKLLTARMSTSRWVSVPIIFPGIVTAIPVGKEEVLVPASPAGRINVSVVESQK
jgi:maltose operon protein